MANRIDMRKYAHMKPADLKREIRHLLEVNGELEDGLAQVWEDYISRLPVANADTDLRATTYTVNKLVCPDCGDITVLPEAPADDDVVICGNCQGEFRVKGVL